MANYAVIKDGIVDNVIVADTKEIAEAVHETDQSSQSQTKPSSQSTNLSKTTELFHILTDTTELTSPEMGSASFLAFANASLLLGVGTVPFQPPRT
jgi:hypothetical protein